MKKRELLEKIVALEKRVAALEAGAFGYWYPTWPTLPSFTGTYPDGVRYVPTVGGGTYDPMPQEPYTICEACR